VAANSDAFWANRKNRKWSPDPERIATSLFIQDLSAQGRVFRVYREVHIGGGRIDLIVNILGNEYVLELKMCGAPYSRGYAESGFDQLKDYLKLTGVLRGYLLVFDGRVKQTGPDEIPVTVDLGDSMQAICVSVNLLGIGTT
jgi:hypothetical protein